MGKSYYYQSASGGSTINTADMILQILTGFVGGPTGSVATTTHGGVTAAQLNSMPATTGGISNLLTQQNNSQPTDPPPPQAYINYVFFDEQFKYVSGGFSQVASAGQLKDHYAELQNKLAQKNGYVYIYVSNTSATNVFFDNLQVVHTRGAILEETHYYPFGLTMSGISSKALSFGNPTNKIKFNGIEQNNDFDINMYDAQYRNLDPQIGRFWQIDPKPNEMYSSYSAMQNNPIRYSDPLGDTVVVDKASMGTEYQQNGQTVTGAQLGQQMVDEWASASGLNLSINGETGMVTETGVATNKGYSKSARKQVRKMLGKGGKVTIGFSQKESSEAEVGGSKITLGVNEIEQLVKGTPSSLVSTTMGYGMTAMHEWFHTKPGGSFEHSGATYMGSSYAARLDKPDIEMNKIRAELSGATGLNYGQRGAYTGVWWWDKNGQNGNTYSPMGQLSPSQYGQMQQAMRSKDASLLPQVPFMITPLPNLPR